MRATLYAGPTDDPITPAEVRMHLRNPEGSIDDAKILGFIKTATEVVEHKLDMALLTQTWDLHLDAWPNTYWCGWGWTTYGLSYLEIPKRPLQSITSLSYLDSAGASVTADPASYIIDTTSDYGRVYLASGASWPTLVTDRPNPATLRIVAGYTSPNLIPEKIKTWMMIYITQLYQQRGPLVVGQAVNELQFVERMLDAHRMPSV